MPNFTSSAEHQVFRSVADRARGRRRGPDAGDLRRIPPTWRRRVARRRSLAAEAARGRRTAFGATDCRASRRRSRRPPRQALESARGKYPRGRRWVQAPRRAAPHPEIVWSTRRRSPRRTTSRPRGVKPSVARSTAPRAARPPTQRRLRGLVVAAAAWVRYRGGGPGAGASSRSAPGRPDPRWSDAGRSTPPRRWRLAHAGGSGLGGARARSAADSRVRTTLLLLTLESGPCVLVLRYFLGSASCAAMPRHMVPGYLRY